YASSNFSLLSGNGFLAMLPVLPLDSPNFWLWRRAAAHEPIHCGVAHAGTDVHGVEGVFLDANGNLVALGKRHLPLAIQRDGACINFRLRDLAGQKSPP